MFPWKAKKIKGTISLRNVSPHLPIVKQVFLIFGLEQLILSPKQDSDLWGTSPSKLAGLIPRELASLGLALR